MCVHRRVICAQGVAHMCTQVMCDQGVAHVCAQVVCAQEGGVHTGGGTHLCTGGVCAHGWHTCAHRWPCARREEPALAIGSFPGRLCRFSPAATWPLLQSVCLPSVPGLPPPLWGPRQWGVELGDSHSVVAHHRCTRVQSMAESFPQVIVPFIPFLWSP